MRRDPPCTPVTGTLVLGAIGLALGAPAVGSPADGDGGSANPDRLRAFLARHCFECHGPDKQKADLRLDELALEFSRGREARLWVEVVDKLNAGEMPPRGLPDAAAEEASRSVAAWLAERLAEGRLARLAEREPVSFHRLSREEYAFTIRDLLGVELETGDACGLPRDDLWQGFERIGSVLSFSASHLERYLAVAEAVLEEALPEAPVEASRVVLSAMDLVGGPELYGLERIEELRAAGRVDDVRIDLWPRQLVQVAPSGPWLEHAGTYRIRVTLSGVPSTDGRAPHLALYAADLDHLLGSCDVVAPEGEPTTVELEAHLPVGAHELVFVNEVRGPTLLTRLGRSNSRPFLGLAEGRIPWQIPLLDDEGRPLHPVLMLDRVELEGPLPPSEPGLRERLVPRIGRDMEAPAVAAEVAARLGPFLSLAWRRPAGDDELAPFVELYLERWNAGETARSALRTTLAAVLCSKDFLYLVEGAAEPGAVRLTSFELAARLSAFLTSTLPDEELRARAADGSLLEPAVLRAQVERLLASPRAKRFARSFARQWLQLERVGRFPPDVLLYPEYGPRLERSMVRQSEEFLAEVAERNLGLAELLDSDWTMLDACLARHYGIPGVEGDGFRRVELDPGWHRGGILTNASVLSLTSDGTRHRPVHRGVWLSETILGETPPAPPANVEPIEPTPLDRPKATVRMQLEAHRADPSCAACHRRIDPLGLAFDNYDAIGRWRTTERVLTGVGDDPPVDASGVLPDGRAFSGPGELQALLRQDVDRFADAFVEKLAAYALRRPTGIDDREELAALTRASAEGGYRLGDLIRHLVLSDLFARR